MKLLAAAAAAATTNSTVGGAAAVYVVTSGAFTLSVVDSDGTAGGTDGTVLGTIEVPTGWTGIIHKYPNQFLKGGNNAAKFTKIDSGAYY